MKLGSQVLWNSSGSWASLTILLVKKKTLAGTYNELIEAGFFDRLNALFL